VIFKMKVHLNTFKNVSHKLMFPFTSIYKEFGTTMWFLWYIKHVFNNNLEKTCTCHTCTLLVYEKPWNWSLLNMPEKGDIDCINSQQNRRS
jgi:hypothetical protein